MGKFKIFSRKEPIDRADSLQFFNYLPSEPNVLMIQKDDEKYVLIVNENYKDIRFTHEKQGLNYLVNDLKIIEKVRIYRDNELLSTRQFLSDLLVQKGFDKNIIPNILFHAFEPLITNIDRKTPSNRY